MPMRNSVKMLNEAVDRVAKIYANNPAAVEAIYTVGRIANVVLEADEDVPNNAPESAIGVIEQPTKTYNYKSVSGAIDEAKAQELIKTVFYDMADSPEKAMKLLIDADGSYSVSPSYWATMLYAMTGCSCKDIVTYDVEKINDNQWKRQYYCCNERFNVLLNVYASSSIDSDSYNATVDSVDKVTVCNCSIDTLREIVVYDRRKARR